MAITEEKIIIPSDINIGATIAYQDKEQKRPLVLLISGTGSLDRDGNAIGFKTNLYKDLSDMFVEMGFVCIRYDKRGTHESKTSNMNFGVTELVDDAATIIKSAKNLEYIDPERVIVCGHSEGAMITTLLTEKTDLKGIILLAGAGMSLRDASTYQNYLIVDQVKDMKGILGWFLRKLVKEDKIEKQLDELYEKAERCKKDTFFYKGSIIPAKYMREHGRLTTKEYLELLKSYKGKVLAITGKSDVQADYRKLELLEGLESVSIETPKGINHLLRDTDNEPDILNIKKEYARTLKQPISSKISNSIREWSKEI